MGVGRCEELRRSLAEVAWRAPNPAARRRRTAYGVPLWSADIRYPNSSPAAAAAAWSSPLEFLTLSRRSGFARSPHENRP